MDIFEEILAELQISIHEVLGAVQSVRGSTKVYKMQHKSRYYYESVENIVVDFVVAK